MRKFEKIEYLKKKCKNKISKKTLQQENSDQEQAWKVWGSPEKRQDKTNETQKNVRQEKTKKNTNRSTRKQQNQEKEAETKLISEIKSPKLK